MNTLAIPCLQQVIRRQREALSTKSTCINWLRRRIVAPRRTPTDVR